MFSDSNVNIKKEQAARNRAVVGGRKVKSQTVSTLLRKQTLLTLAKKNRRFLKLKKKEKYSGCQEVTIFDNSYNVERKERERGKWCKLGGLKLRFLRWERSLYLELERSNRCVSFYALNLQKFTTPSGRFFGCCFF